MSPMPPRDSGEPKITALLLNLFSTKKQPALSVPSLYVTLQPIGKAGTKKPRKMNASKKVRKKSFGLVPEKAMVATHPAGATASIDQPTQEKHGHIADSKTLTTFPALPSIPEIPTSAMSPHSDISGDTTKNADSIKLPTVAKLGTKSSESTKKPDAAMFVLTP